MNSDITNDYLAKLLNTNLTTINKLICYENGDLLPTRQKVNDICTNYVNYFLNPDKKFVHRWLVIPGLRGVGKTTLMAQIYSHLNSLNKDFNLLYFSLDEVKALNITLSDILKAYELIITDDYYENLTKPTFIFIDEIQTDPNWADLLKTIYDRSSKIFFICSGSSALNLQMSANIVGRRALVEKLYPLKFTEFKLLKDDLDLPDFSNDIFKFLYHTNSPRESYNQLLKLKPKVDLYWTKCRPKDIDTYLTIGSLPLALRNNDQEVYKLTQAIIDKVITTDLKFLKGFNLETLDTIPKLLFHLAVMNNDLPLDTLSKNLFINRKKLIEILNALVKAEILIKIPAVGGSPFSSSRKPARYNFIGSSVRASYFNIISSQAINQSRRGLLLEDVASLHYNQHFIDTKIGSLSYYTSEKQADFNLQINRNKQIVIEIGLGQKDNSQILNTMNKRDYQYGVVISNHQLTYYKEQNIIHVPLKYFLLI